MDKTNWYNATHSSLRELGVTLNNYQQVCHDRTQRKTRFKQSYDFMQVNDIKRWKTNKNKKDLNKDENILIRQIFSKLDRDNDGLVQTREVVLFLANLNMISIPPPEEEDKEEMNGIQKEHDFTYSHKKLPPPPGNNNSGRMSRNGCVSLMQSRQSMTECKPRSPEPVEHAWMGSEKVNFSQFKNIINSNPKKHLFFNNVFSNFNNTLNIDSQLQMIMRQNLNGLLGSTAHSQKEKESARKEIQSYQRTLQANSGYT